MINGVTVTGLYYEAPTTTNANATGWWISTSTQNKFARVVSMKNNGQVIAELAATSGYLTVPTGTARTLQRLQGTSLDLQLELDAPLSATLRIISSTDTATYSQYVTQWLPLGAASGTAWSTFCPHPYAAGDGTNSLPEYMIPVAGANWQLDGSRTDGAGRIQLSCTHDMVGGCIRWGYEPFGARNTPTGLVSAAAMRNTHQACTRMKRADFCGTGDPTTTVNASPVMQTRIQLWDTHGIYAEGMQTADSMEAHWAPNGASCVNRGAWRTDDTVAVQRFNDQLRICDYLPSCTDLDASKDGGLVSSGHEIIAVGSTGTGSTN